jgi:uncharacterized ferritin-like protein (DUF455 family)
VDPLPPSGTVERWCLERIATRVLEAKLAPPPPPPLDEDSSWEPAHPAFPVFLGRRPARPGRPDALQVTCRSPRTPRPGALARPGANDARAALLHTLLHHELQAAELFCWAVLAFPDTPRDFRAGLVRLAQEELGHLALYRRQLERLGFAVGDFEVRDWFWERVPQCATPAAFVALQGLGLEGANLEHSARFAVLFRRAGDVAGAEVLERVERDEVAHLAFAARWFERFTGAPLDYDTWRAHLPPPLTPALLRGPELNRAARGRAGMDARFLDRLEAEPPATARPGQPRPPAASTP